MKKPIVHELKAHDFTLETLSDADLAEEENMGWRPIVSCPRDGSTFTAQCTDGQTHVATWRERPVILDAVEPTIRAISWWGPRK
jgi:hypothetical protein